jgi:hypothetical protein
MSYRPEEIDLVELRERIDPWPAGTQAVVVDVGDRAALVEVVESTPGIYDVEPDDRVVEAQHEQLRLIRHARVTTPAP